MVLQMVREGRPEETSVRPCLIRVTAVVLESTPFAAAVAMGLVLHVAVVKVIMPGEKVSNYRGPREYSPHRTTRRVHGCVLRRERYHRRF